MTNCGVYLIENPLGDIYVGSSLSLSERINQYRTPRCHRPIEESFRKYGFDAHKFTVLEYCDHYDIFKLRELECFYISYLESLGLNLLNVFNTRKAINYKNNVPRTDGELIRKEFHLEPRTVKALKAKAKKEGRSLKNYMEQVFIKESQS